MPIYEYKCTSCHHHFDLMQKVTEEPAKECPECFEDALIKLVSAAGFQLKGTGWYASDFKHKPSTQQETTNSKEDLSKKNKDKVSAETPAKITDQHGDT